MALYKGGKTQRIPLNKLKPDLENMRFEPVASKGDAVSVMINHEREEIGNLADDIVDLGLSRASLPIVYPSGGDGTYIVADGNRRLISIIALLDPEVVPDSMPTLRKKLSKLKHGVSLKERVLCAVYPDRKSAMTWVKKQHLGPDDGRGTRGWDAVIKERSEAREKGYSSRALAAWEFLKKGADKDLLDTMENPKNFTGFARVIDDRHARRSMGLIIEKGVVTCKDEGRSRKLLGTVVTDFEKDGYKVADVYTAPLRTEYVANLRHRALGEDDSRTSSESDTSLNPRKTLIPSGTACPIAHNKIRAIFSELRGLTVARYPIGVAFLLRSLLELSLTRYESLEPNYAKRLPTGRDRDKLQVRLEILFAYLNEEKGLSKPKLLPFKKATVANRHIPLTQELNGYVHSEKFMPMPMDLLATWDNVSDLMQLIWVKEPPVAGAAK